MKAFFDDLKKALQFALENGATASIEHDTGLKNQNRLRVKVHGLDQADQNSFGLKSGAAEHRDRLKSTSVRIELPKSGESIQRWLTALKGYEEFKRQVILLGRRAHA